MTAASSSVRAENAAQLVLMLGVGSGAAAAAWSQVVHLVERHGQPGWLAVADAAVLETLAVSMGLDVRRRRRQGESPRVAVCVLVAAVVLQLSAQVAEAPPTFWGWTMAALPAVGFLLLAKVAMTRTVAAPDPTGEALAQTGRSVPEPDDARVPASVPASPMAGPTGHRAGEPNSTPPGSASGADLRESLLEAGRQVAADLAHHHARISRASLTAGLRGRGVRVGTERTGQLLATLRAERDQAERDRSVADRTLHEPAAEDHRDRGLAWVGTRP